MAGINVNSEGYSVTVRGILLSGVFDAPAKCAVQNFCQYSGFYGCPYCMEKGVTCWTSAWGHKTIFPFNLESENGHALSRTHSDTIRLGEDAQKETIKTGKPHSYFGVKGLTWCMYFPKFDVIRGMAIDYMHAVLLGVLKMLTTLWFDKS